MRNKCTYENKNLVMRDTISSFVSILMYALVPVRFSYHLLFYCLIAIYEDS